MSKSADFTRNFKSIFPWGKLHEATVCHKFSFDNKILISFENKFRAREKKRPHSITRILSIFDHEGPVAKGFYAIHLQIIP